MDIIQSHDINILSETWISKNTCYNLDIKGYRVFHLYGNKSINKTKGRYSGGISIYYKSDLSDKINIVETNQYGIVWIKVCKTLFDFEADVYICSTYIPPSSSKVIKQHETDMFDLIETGIEKYKLQGKVFISGDLNSRTSNERDFIIFDKHLDENTELEYNINNNARINKDHVIDARGKRLISLCKSANLLICNGRLLEDSNIGEFTFLNNNANTVIDYVLANQHDLKYFSTFKIEPNNEFSDHCAVHFSLRCKRPIESRDRENGQEEPFIAWDSSRVTSFCDSMLNQCPVLDKITRDLDSISIDESLQSFTTLLWDNAFEHFGKTKINKNNNPNRKAWFTGECYQARKEFNKARNIFLRNKTNENRIVYIFK